jgi:hypothetical protein
MSDMNSLIAGAARSRRVRRGGLIDALKDTDLGDGRRERVSQAEIRYETAIKRGDEVGREMADAELTAILDEGRAARAAAQEAPAAQPISFDGGVQKRVHKPAYQEAVERANESPATLLRRAFQASADRPTRGSSFL